MELITVFENGSFKWVDVVGPTRSDLDKISQEYGLHHTSVQDCLDPEHLPKFEKIGDVNFLILRAYDSSSATDADTIQELTRKIAIFFTDRFLLTIHRAELPFLKTIKEGPMPEKSTGFYLLLNGFLSAIVRNVFSSYEKPVDQALERLEKLEMGVFGAQGAKRFEIAQGYYLKRQASIFRRMFRMSIDLLPRIAGCFEGHSANFQDLKDEAESYLYYADDLMESVTSLLNLHISLSSQKTNEATYKTGEVVRLLTVFSVFLLPLNVITGIYGMNFEYMPELRWHLGYPLTIGMMLTIELGIYLYFKKKGWLKF